MKNKEQELRKFFQHSDEEEDTKSDTEPISAAASFPIPPTSTKIDKMKILWKLKF